MVIARQIDVEPLKINWEGKQLEQYIFGNSNHLDGKAVEKMGAKSKSNISSDF